MPGRKGHLTTMERTFAAYMAKTGDRIYSAAKAGYAHPTKAASQNMQNPDVADDVRRNARQMLQTHGAEVGVAVLVELACDQLQKGSTRATAAKALVQLSGVAGPAGLSEKDISEMGPDEIRTLLSQAQAALAARIAAAKTIEHEPAQLESGQAEPSIFG